MNEIEKQDEYVTMENGEKKLIVDMALCEPSHIFLRPNVIYRFRAIPGCKKCEEIAAIYSNEEKS